MITGGIALLATASAFVWSRVAGLPLAEAWVSCLQLASPVLSTCLVAMVIIQQCQRDGIAERSKLHMRRGFIGVSFVAIGASMLTTTKLLASGGARLIVVGITAWLVLVNLAAIVDATAE